MTAPSLAGGVDVGSAVAVGVPVGAVGVGVAVGRPWQLIRLRLGSHAAQSEDRLLSKPSGSRFIDSPSSTTATKSPVVQIPALTAVDSHVWPPAPNST